jgi:hypothetical protein
MLKRSDITGHTLNILGYSIEFVYVKHWLNCVAIYKNHNSQLVKRFEI